jgi:uncharacterized protein (UPF0548 family)
MARRLRHQLRDEAVHSGPDAAAAFEKARRHVLDFNVYDRTLVAADLPAGGVAPGLEFTQRMRVGPLRLKGPVRVTDVWDRATPRGREAGFTYLALPGHVEVGQATFAVALSGDEVRFRIESRSAPGPWFVRVGTPVARIMQRRAYAQAFRRMRALLAGPSLGDAEAVAAELDAHQAVRRADDARLREVEHGRAHGRGRRRHGDGGGHGQEGEGEQQGDAHAPARSAVAIKSPCRGRRQGPVHASRGGINILN